MPTDNFSLNEERGPLLEAAQRVVRDVVKWYRSFGNRPIGEALQAAALDLDTSYWRTRSLHYRDGIWSIARHEHDRLLRQYGQHLDNRMAALEREAEAIRERRAQLQFDLNDNTESGDGEWRGGGTAARRLPSGAGGPQ